jgi:hypothetical protein
VHAFKAKVFNRFRVDPGIRGIHCLIFQPKLVSAIQKYSVRIAQLSNSIQPTNIQCTTIQRTNTQRTTIPSKTIQCTTIQHKTI